MKRTDILQCPFCGVTPSPALIPQENDTAEYAVIACKNSSCHVKPKTGSVMPKGEAVLSVIRRWNTRNHVSVF